MRAYYTDHFVLPLPENHRFPMDKYARLRDVIIASDSGVVDLLVPDAATNEQLTGVHDPDYVSRVVEGRLDRLAVRRIGFPWSPELVERSRRSVGATLSACSAALVDGVSVNLAGGTHHAGVGHGEGYCVFNDAAVAARVLQGEGRVERVIVIDCDVHQGNGTAEIFVDDPSVFTFDLYGEHNYPFTKTEPDLGIPLPDGTGDADYLEALTSHLHQALDADQWSLAIYVSGADPFAGDKLGRLSITKSGLATRDEVVMHACRNRRIPVATVMAGGYAEATEDIVDIHLTTVRIAAQAMETERV